jgi:hypothetical protein
MFLQRHRLSLEAIPEAMDPSDCLQPLKRITCCQCRKKAFALKFIYNTL